MNDSVQTGHISLTSSVSMQYPYPLFLCPYFSLVAVLFAQMNDSVQTVVKPQWLPL